MRLPTISRRGFALAAGLSIGLWTLPLAVSAAGPPDALQQDAVHYADAYGTTLEEAVQRLRFQEDAARVDDLLARRAPDTYAGLWLDHSSDRLDVTSRFVGGSVAFETVRTELEAEARRAALERSANPGLADQAVDAATLRAIRALAPEDALYSLRDLEEATAQGHYLLGQLEATGDLEIDVRENRVILWVVDDAALREALESRRLPLPAPIEILTTDALAEPVADVYGGLPASTCTWGFSVKNSSGTKGVSTAGHCGNSQSYSGTSLPFQSECYRDNYDVQWHTDGTRTAQPKIKVGSGTRDIYGSVSRTSQPNGAYVCKQGKTTGYNCGTISSKTYAPSYVPSVNATFIRVKNQGSALTIAGDSGGPWFSGNNAWGITSGRVGNDGIYTAINYLSCLGVSVLTTTPPPPPEETCEDWCYEDYSECLVDACYWDEDEDMCNFGCREERDLCIADC